MKTLFHKYCIGVVLERIGNCFLADVRHNLWEICIKGRAYNLNLTQISCKVRRALSGVNV